ncbi:MAG TPA: transglutaminase family protein [Verrucomicrobiae bacterium]|nr:transglutaminase family protein [Verrucomicrobiae bacterium]
MKYDILHRTRYVYAAPVRDSFNDARLQPVPDARQTVESFLLRVLPAARLSHYTDFYSNWVHHFEIPEPHAYLLIESHSQVVTHPPEKIDAGTELCPLEKLGEAQNVERCYDFLQSSRYIEIEADAWRLAVDATIKHTDVWQSALSLLRFVHGFLKYEPNSTHVHTHMAEVIQDRRGVCQDFAHLMIGLCRSVKIPARYVSGYLATEIASATHAWVEIFIPGHGWCGLDPTHNCQVDGAYVKLGHGRDYADVPPISGNYRGTLDRKMEVEVKITPLE